MDQIWAPWRIKYIELKKPAGCILCSKPKENKDIVNYILYRGKYNFIMLNSYPYNPGHVMVSPYQHSGALEDLTNIGRNEHFEIVSRVVSILKQVFNPAGFNIGINLGREAGAGIVDHWHTHIVPRWQGDTNFMPIVSAVHVIPEALTETYEKLCGKF